MGETRHYRWLVKFDQRDLEMMTLPPVTRSQVLQRYGMAVDAVPLPDNASEARNG